MSARRPRPQPDADTRVLWEGLERGELLLQHCLACDAVQYYQQVMCRTCGSDALEHRAATGRGTVHSFSVVHRAPGPEFAAETPYAILLVTLEEGPRMISRLIDGDPEAVTFDMAVELACVREDDGVTLPYFRPA